MTSKLTPSDEKRIKSLSDKRILYQEQKSLIKNSLANIDVARAKKIKFDEDDDDRIAEREPSSKHSKKSKITKVSHENGNKKSQLFDDDSDGEDDFNFEIKQQFEGETGQKLMKLQSGYKNDKRFVLDERFLEDDHEDEMQIDVNNEMNDHSNERTVDNDDNIETIDTADLNEKQKQMEILNGILGTNHSMFKKYENGDVNKKAAAVKTMLRFDPSKPDHSKYISTPVEKEIVKKKKQKKDNTTNTPKTPIVQAPEVSKERFYKIDETITQSLGSEQPFSLLSLFGKNVEDNLNEEEKYESKSLTVSKNPLDEKNTFRYDSSDTEDEKEETQINGESHTDSAVLNQPSTLVSFEKFFFDKNDPRFKEGLEFFTLRNTSSHDHLEFKKAINKRMHNMKSDRNISKNKKQIYSNQKNNMKSNFKMSKGNQSQSNGNHTHKANRRNIKR